MVWGHHTVRTWRPPAMVAINGRGGGASFIWDGDGGTHALPFLQQRRDRALACFRTPWASMAGAASSDQTPTHGGFTITQLGTIAGTQPRWRPGWVPQTPWRWRPGRAPQAQPRWRPGHAPLTHLRGRGRTSTSEEPSASWCRIGAGTKGATSCAKSSTTSSAARRRSSSPKRCPATSKSKSPRGSLGIRRRCSRTGYTKRSSSSAAMDSSPRNASGMWPAARRVAAPSPSWPSAPASQTWSVGIGL